MAGQSDQTIKEMLAGFSAMQYNLGLLPMQTTQAMAGAPMQAAAPPPPVMHPSQAAANALAQQQQMIQQTLQAAQVTRYQPPPSAPTPAVSAMAGFGAMNPFAAPAVGGAGYAPNGGGFAPVGGGFAGGARGYATPSLSPMVPSVLNPFSPSLPSPHFMTPAQRSLQVVHTDNSQMAGMVAGIGQGVAGIGGGILGGMLGSRLGPLGTIAGGVLGSAIGGGIANMVFNPAIQDAARGRAIQNMSAPWMMGGPFVNSATGQGFNSEAARQVGTGIRHLQRDWDFERTGFNTQDTMRMMQSSSQVGLLAGIQSPDQLVSKMKDIAKTVKVLTRITGDPDVQSAIRSLGEMRDLGFQGLGMQGGAMANRAMFARMAGVSQAQAGAYGGMGAGIAGQYGLVGATGYMAGMAGAASANFAVSSGAVNDLQLARAGGQAGLAQINARGQLAAMNDDRYLLAAMGRDAKGNMTVDMDAYRKAQGMSFQEVSERAAEALRKMDSKGIFEWNSRRQEMKDQVAQKLSPFEMQANMVKQAMAFQGQFRPGEMNLGTALQSTTGMSASDARALELQFSSRGFYDTSIQQLEAQKRQAMDQQRAKRDVYRTQGLGTRMGRGAREFIGGISDTLSSPFTSFMENMRRVDEEEEAAGRGETIMRFKEHEIARTGGERRMMRAGLRNSALRSAYIDGAGGSLLDEGGGTNNAGFGRNLNRLGSMFGVSALSGENRLVAIAHHTQGRAFGHGFGETFGDKDAALRRVRDVVGAADAMDDASGMTGRARAEAVKRLSSGGISVGQGMLAAQDVLRSSLKEGAAGYVMSADAASGSQLREAGIAFYTSQGKSRAEAEQLYEANKKDINAMLARNVQAVGVSSQMEQFMKSADAKEKLGGIDWRRSREGGQKMVNSLLEQSGLRRGAVASEIADLKTGGYKVSDKALSGLKASFAADDVERDKEGNMTKRAQRVMAAAAAMDAREQGTPEARKQATEYLKRLEQEVGGEEYDKIIDEAQQKLGGISGDARKALRQTMNVGDAAGLESRIGNVDLALQAGMANAARTAGMQKVDDLAGAGGKIAGGKDYVKTLQGLNDEQIAAIAKNDPETAKKLKALRGLKGEDAASAVDDVIQTLAPTNTQERSMQGGAGVESINRQIADMRAMRDKLAKEDKGSTKSQLESKATEIFSSAVERFGKYVQDAVGGGEGTMLDRANPYNQAAKGAI